MADYIPFVTSESGAGLVKSYYADATIVRVPFERAAAFTASLPTGTKLWIDGCVDGMDDIESRRSSPGKPNSWFDCMKTTSNFEAIGDLDFQKAPVRATVEAFVYSVMNKCHALKATWITVPQLPATDGTERNKINRALALAAGKWRAVTSFSGRLILPLIVTNQRQINSKTVRNKKVELASRCYQDARADGIWFVDSSLVDDSGSATLRTTRLPGLMAMHEEMNEKISSKIRIAGPYWGANLVLWAKGLVDHPAIGLGSGYQYFLSGRPGGRLPTVKIALPALRRRVGLVGLGSWLSTAMGKLGPGHPAFAEFTGIKARLSILSDLGRAKQEVARFYQGWFSAIASAPKAGRSMAMFQDLSAAYALGKALPDLEDAGTARRPECVAEPLMLSCL
jgi:hypothetical protein